MREIKFKAWDKGGKQFVDDVLIAANKYGFLYCNYNRCEFEGEDRDIVIMQYTGLKDKNGNEIYEGDIVGAKRGDKTHKGTIKFSQKCFDYRVYTYPEHLYMPLCEFYPIEVIGNIYENGDLLK